MEGSFLNFAGLIVGLVGVIATVVVAVRYAHKKDPRVFASTDQKVAMHPDAPQAIQIAFRGSPVPRVSSTLLWLWNHGKTPILETDIPPSQPIELVLRSREAVTILDARVRKVSRESIAFTVAPVAPDRLRIGFAFLDAGDGAVVEVTHTGGRDTRVRSEGVILGAPDGFRVTMDVPVPPDPLQHSISRHTTRAVGRQPGVLAKLALSLLMIGVFGGVAALLFSSAASFRTTPDRIAAALTGTVPPASVPAIVRQLQEGWVPQQVKRAGRIGIGGLSLLVLAVVLVSTWAAERSYPASLALVSEEPESGRHSKSLLGSISNDDTPMAGPHR